MDDMQTYRENILGVEKADISLANFDDFVDRCRQHDWAAIDNDDESGMAALLGQTILVLAAKRIPACGSVYAIFALNHYNKSTGFPDNGPGLTDEEAEALLVELRAKLYPN